MRAGSLILEWAFRGQNFLKEEMFKLNEQELARQHRSAEGGNGYQRKRQTLRSCGGPEIYLQKPGHHTPDWVTSCPTSQDDQPVPQHQPPCVHSFLPQASCPGQPDQCVRGTVSCRHRLELKLLQGCLQHS